ncbi:hypothetical protein HDU92_001966, partial [Lobulomyces angularis]
TINTDDLKAINLTFFNEIERLKNLKPYKNNFQDDKNQHVFTIFWVVKDSKTFGFIFSFNLDPTFLKDFDDNLDFINLINENT